MAGSKQKKRITTNATIMRNHYVAVGVVNLIYLIYVLYNFANVSTLEWIAFISLSLGYAFCLNSLYKYSKPLEYTTNEGKQVIDVNDLSDVSGSLTEYTFDIIYIECFVQLASIISCWFYLVLLIIPGFAIFKLYNSIIKPYLSMNKAQQEYANSQQQAASDNMSDKKKKKMERLEKKNQQNMQRMRIRPSSNQDDE